MAGTRVYVGNLPHDVSRREVEDLFAKYGRFRVDIKEARGPGGSFAFLEFNDPRDAEDAVRGRDGHSYDGVRLKVQFARSRGLGYGGAAGGGGMGGRGPPQRSKYRVRVEGLPPSASWQDLKDHMRAAGDVGFADVDRDNGVGIVEFNSYDDVKYAIRKLDNSEFMNRFSGGRPSVIRVREDRPPSRGRSGSPRGRSPSPRRGRSPSPRRDRSGSPRRDRSGSPRRDRSGSPPRRDRSGSPKARSPSPKRGSASPSPRGRDLDRDRDASPPKDD